MGYPVIVLGDKTSHGGVVISASSFSDTHGKGWARRGDMVSCPLCKGVFPISQGDPSLIDDGKPVAYHGCKVACGATLISSQIFTTTVPSSGAAPDAANGTMGRAIGAIGSGLSAGYHDEALPDTRRFRGALSSRRSGNGRAGERYRNPHTVHWWSVSYWGYGSRWVHRMDRTRCHGSIGL